ncbi:hypothetical protein PM082_013399 [Marasmius tenuissimus]|nr:hypothetical protein PM082_013399 [Marasmius tenuissimus]
MCLQLVLCNLCLRHLFFPAQKNTPLTLACLSVFPSTPCLLLAPEIVAYNVEHRTHAPSCSTRAITISRLLKSLSSENYGHRKLRWIDRTPGDANEKVRFCHTSYFNPDTLSVYSSSQINVHQQLSVSNSSCYPECSWSTSSNENRNTGFGNIQDGEQHARDNSGYKREITRNSRWWTDPYSNFSWIKLSKGWFLNFLRAILTGKSYSLVTSLGPRATAIKFSNELLHDSLIVVEVHQRNPSSLQVSRTASHRQTRMPISAPDCWISQR